MLTKKRWNKGTNDYIIDYWLFKLETLQAGNFAKLYDEVDRTIQRFEFYQPL